MATLAFDRAPSGIVARGLLLRLAYDRASDRRLDDDGRLHVKDCPITKATVNDYYGYEIPEWEELGLDPKRKYAMLRDPEELDKAAKAGLFDGIPLLDTHTPHEADAPVKDKVAGCIGAGCYFDGEYVRTPLLSVWAQDDIEAIESEEKRELSSSYAYDPVMKPGNFKGLRYDGRMVNIRPNHVALVERGRAGRDVLVNDALPKGLKMKRKTFDRFVKKAGSLFANDADIDAEELVNLIAAASAAEEKEGELNGEGADDDDLNPDPNAMDALPEELRAKLTDDEWEQVRGCMSPKPKADDEDGEGEEGEGGEGEEGEGEDGKGRANDAKPRRKPRANDADAIRNQVVREMSAWNTACEKVAPHIGRVKLAMDAVPGGAATLYKRALDAHGVSHKGITQVTALERMVDMLPSASRPTLAHDALPAGEASPLDTALKGAVRIARS